MHVKAGDGRVEVQCPFPKLAAFNLVASRTVDPTRDGARYQRMFNPANRLAEPPIAIKRPGERRLSCKIFPQPQVLVCSFNSFCAVFYYVLIVINKIIVVIDFAVLRRLQIRSQGPFLPVGRGPARARKLAKLADRCWSSGRRPFETID